ncbi:MarR family transcriptional regulator [Sulfitobacter sp. LCG007]
MDPDLPISITVEVRDRCLCLHAQRAARRLGRAFDEALRPVGLTNGQFSLLMSLNRPEGPKLGDLTGILAMDRTTITAALKPLERRRLVESLPDPEDARARRLRLTDQGRAVLKAALPIWRATHDRIDTLLSEITPDALRGGLLEVLADPA